MEGYHRTRLAFDPRRDIVWRSLWTFYFSRIISLDDCVLDLGCGYGEFINNVVARRRIAVDAWDHFPEYVDPDVERIVGSVTDLDFIAPGAINFAFASNLFEHLSHEDFTRVLQTLRSKLAENGTLNILQPNYRYAYREYFDDYTHISVFSHISMADFLGANGFNVFEVRPRFLPLTVKSRLPVSPWLIRAYLASPIKPLAKQMLIRASVSRSHSRSVQSGTEDRELRPRKAASRVCSRSGAA
ncbi:MAG: class I SAM-dependent methyltransferase [Alphaproteobacteria bacterium]|nr:class I SAM-dependent methyltransferase [Alphaproteobacteria bacterium]